jgi:hypothetical protein
LDELRTGRFANIARQPDGGAHDDEVGGLETMRHDGSMSA